MSDPVPPRAQPAEQTEHKGAAPSPARAALCLFFDLESTGLHLGFAEVVEIAAVACMVGTDGAWRLLGNSPQCQGAASHFHRLIRPSRRMPKKLETLTGLSNAVLEERGIAFQQAIWDWTAWLHAVTSAANRQGVTEVWLVGHNAMFYDLPLLLSQGARAVAALERGWPGARERFPAAAGGSQAGPDRVLLEGLGVVTGVVDTLQLSRRLAAYGLFAPSSHRLGSLYQEVVGRRLSGAHSARGDTLGMLELCSRPPFHEAFVRSLHGGESVAVSMPEALARARRRMASGPRVTNNVQGGEAGRRKSGGRPNRVAAARKRTSTAVVPRVGGDGEQKRPCRRSFLPRKSSAGRGPPPEAWGPGRTLGGLGGHPPPRAQEASPLPHLLGAARAVAPAEVVPYSKALKSSSRTPTAQEATARGAGSMPDQVPTLPTRRWKRGVLRTRVPDLRKSS